ncbi:hypothetical protein B0T26DRAFT_467297 [Lasiosphaeria miniovina]|uniref:CFEM domain-containing protein n=1 Tax=Lasiosphaeria miniovina TaxID=1954250 RepID=A0AA39ZZV0_9PEZI|nr:uncharacterized protein B0T26DRAFT_467297 [Lasiosphaeria miniovina]KAK0706677.1 hypothetical protein B0T26DRAFT_467297 [Lasiosphaeria miniovina]
MRANSAPTSRLSIALLFFSLQALGRTAAPHGLPSDVASRVPDCGLGCLQQLINSATANASSACLEAGTDAACLCEKDISQYGSVLSCVQANCTIEDAIGSRHLACPFLLHSLSQRGNHLGCKGRQTDRDKTPLVGRGRPAESPNALARPISSCRCLSKCRP